MSSSEGSRDDAGTARRRGARSERTRGSGSAGPLLDLARAALVIVAYTLAAEVGLRFATIPPHVTLVWPAAGIAVAAVFLWGWRMAPAVGLAALYANASLGLELPFALCLAAGNALEAVCGAAMLKAARVDSRLARRRDVVWFALLPTLVAPIIAATVGAATLSAAGLPAGISFRWTWITWFVGDAVGVLTIAPLLLVWSRVRWRRPSMSTVLEGIALAAFALFTDRMIFLGSGALEAQRSLAFLVTPALLWASTRLGQPAVTALLVFFEADAVWSISRGSGIFFAGSDEVAILHLWLFVGVVSFCTMLLTAIVAEHEAAERARARSERRLRRATEEAHERETRLRMLTEQIPTAVVWTTDRDLRMTWAGGGWLRQLGALDEPNRDLADYHPAGSPSQKVIVDAHRRALAGEQVIFEYEWNEFHGEARLEPLRSSTGEIVGVIGVGLDLSESRRSAATLRRVEENLRRAQAIARVGSWEYSFRGDRPRYWSEELVRIIGITAEEGEKLEVNAGDGSWFRNHIVHPDDRADFERSYESRMAQARPLDFRFRIVRRDGAIRHLHALTEPVLDEGGRVIRVVGTLVDETERRQSEETRARLSAIVASSWDAIVGMTTDGVVETWNGGAETILGRRAEEACGQRIGDLLGREAEHEIADLLRRNAAGERITSHRIDLERDGRRVTLAVSLAPIRSGSGAMTGVSLIARDQSDRTRLEEQLQQARKLEAIGTLAGGIAHDFNNLLWVILGNTERVLHKLPGPSPLRPMLENVLAASRRARGVVDQILAFSRRTETKLELFSPSEVVREAVDLLRSTLPSSIQIRTSLDRGSGVVLGDRTHLHQVVMNLCTNAYHAMGEAGVLTIAVEEVEVKSRSELAASGLPPGKYAALEVTDTGCGIDQQSMQRIFEPFYTTKQGSGTGLGLSTVHGMVTSFGGQVRVSSRPGEGSTFRVYLPLRPRSDVAAVADERAEVPGAAKGHVLIVDDEPAVLETLSGMLEDLGYDVTSCRDGAEAMDLVRSGSSSYLAMITDQTMPGLTGLDLARSVHGVRADLPVLLLSGYNRLVTAESLAASHVSGFLAKPLEFGDLERALRRIAGQGE
jgi:PAS domain S-box-containing protein